MSLFRKPNKPVFLKMGIYGQAGSGKTFTASLVSVGIHEAIKSKKPVYIFDTEKGSDWLGPIFKEHGIEFKVLKSRSFADLLIATAEAEKESSVLIIDSITHVWQELIQAYEKKLGRTRLRLQDWQPIKKQWAQFTSQYINSELHIILCGRGQDVYDIVKEEDKGYEVNIKGTRMQAEKELGYEPDVLIEMDFTKNDKNEMVHQAFIKKDRSNTMNGKILSDPTFKDFAPIWGCLNLGGKHVGIDTESNSEGLVQDDDKRITERIRRRQIIIEEVQGLLVHYIPGQAKEDKKAKMDILKTVYNTRSWKRITGDWNAIPLEQLERSLNKLEKECIKYEKKTAKKG